ncbi:MAG: FHIPEP family type III secretion protein [Pseudomonadales bacterium]
MLKILQSLLAEKIPIRDLRTIAEALTEASAVSKDHLSSCRPYARHWDARGRGAFMAAGRRWTSHHAGR